MQRESISQLKNRKRASKSFELDQRRLVPGRATLSESTTQNPSHRTMRSSALGKSTDNKIDLLQEDSAADVKSFGRVTFTNY